MNLACQTIPSLTQLHSLWLFYKSAIQLMGNHPSKNLYTDPRIYATPLGDTELSSDQSIRTYDYVIIGAGMLSLCRISAKIWLTSFGRLSRPMATNAASAVISCGSLVYYRPEGNPLDTNSAAMAAASSWLAMLGALIAPKNVRGDYWIREG